MSDVPPSDVPGGGRPGGGGVGGAAGGVRQAPSKAAGNVVLPEVGGGERRARRSKRRHLGRRRAIGYGATVAGLVLALVALVAFGYDNLRAVGDEPAPLEATGTSVVPDEPGEPAPPRALLVQEGAEGEVVSVTVLVVGPTGAGGNLVFAPVGSMVEVPSFGLNPLRDAFALGGLPLLQQSAENLLRIVFDQVALVTAEDLEALVEPAGTLVVELASAVEVVSEVGRVQTVFPAGPVDVPPNAAAALLEVRGSGSDLDRLVRHQAFWEAWLAAIEGDPSAVPPAEGASGIGAVVAALAAGDVGYDLLPVEVLATGTGPDDDLYAVQGDDLEALVAEVAPGSSAGAADRIRVQVLNGTGVPGLAQEVQPSLAPAGAIVSLTGNADRFDYEVTQVVFYRDEDLRDARAVQRALGVGEVVRSLVALDVVDVTVVVGADFTASDDRVEPTETSSTTADPGA